METKKSIDTLTADISSSNYNVELGITLFNKLESIDFFDIVNPSLEKAGASDIEYNGHFGDYIYFRAHPSKLDNIMGTLNHLLKA